MDARLFLCASFVIAGLACFYTALRIIFRGAPGIASVLTGMGALSLAAVWMMSAGPWRHQDQGVFPIAVVDLSAPPAAIERDQPSN
jgi:hypothetical protein